MSMSENKPAVAMDDASRIAAIAEHYKAILELIGEDPTRQGLEKTPERAAKALWFVTHGQRNPGEAEAVMSQALFDHEGSRMVIVKDIEFYSMCEHHVLPFFGKVSVAYIPDGKIVGLSKLARLVNSVARRLQVQERLTAEVCRKVAKTLNARGVMVICEAEHLCMKMRGVEKQHSSTVTTEYCGLFETDPELRREFFESVRQTARG